MGFPPPNEVPPPHLGAGNHLVAGPPRFGGTEAGRPHLVPKLLHVAGVGVFLDDLKLFHQRLFGQILLERVLGKHKGET